MSRMSDFIICIVEQYANKVPTSLIVENVKNAYGLDVSTSYIEKLVLEYKDLLKG